MESLKTDNTDFADALGADKWNQVAAELNNVILGAGLTPSSTDLQQIWKAIETVGDGKANTSLSNLNATGQAVINGKADTDLSNITATGKETVVGWGMPDIENFIMLPTTAFTCPTNGWIYTGYNGGTSLIYVYFKINNSTDYYGIASPEGNHGHDETWVMVKKGDIITQNSKQGAYLYRFYPCIGG